MDWTAGPSRTAFRDLSGALQYFRPRKRLSRRTSIAWNPRRCSFAGGEASAGPAEVRPARKTQGARRSTKPPRRVARIGREDGGVPDRQLQHGAFGGGEGRVEAKRFPDNPRWSRERLAPMRGCSVVGSVLSLAQWMPGGTRWLVRLCRLRRASGLLYAMAVMRSHRPTAPRVRARKGKPRRGWLMDASNAVFKLDLANAGWFGFYASLGYAIEECIAQNRGIVVGAA